MSSVKKKTNKLRLLFLLCTVKWVKTQCDKVDSENYSNFCLFPLTYTFGKAVASLICYCAQIQDIPSCTQFYVWDNFRKLLFLFWDTLFIWKGKVMMLTYFAQCFGTCLLKGSCKSTVIATILQNWSFLVNQSSFCNF